MERAALPDSLEGDNRSGSFTFPNRRASATVSAGTDELMRYPDLVALMSPLLRQQNDQM